MKSLAQHIVESQIVESSKYSTKLVSAAIAHIVGKTPIDIMNISDEAKGYSYKIKGSNEFRTISYKDVNDCIDHHETAIRKKYFKGEQDFSR